MVISYYGLSCFKIQSGDTSLVFDLPSKKSAVKPPRFQADIFVQSHDHDGHNGVESIAREKARLPARQEFFLVDSPGEYEIKGIYIRGMKSFHDSVSGKKHGVNTVYMARCENVKLCFMGDFGEKEIRPELKEEIGEIDVLFVPIGGETVLDVEGARNAINQIEPAVAIPMHYPDNGKALKSFLAEMGQKDVKPVEKFSIKKKDIDGNGTSIVVLENQGA